MSGNVGSYRKEMVKVRCTESGKVVDAELVRMDKDKIQVVLPGFQKLILNKSNKPHLYTANQFGMEFTCDTSNKK